MPPTIVKSWGSEGVGNGQFEGAKGIAVNSFGDIYVVDSANSRIQKFTGSGTFIMKWGSYGVGDGQFNNPREIAIDSSNNVYVIDYGNFRIQKFTNNGTFLTKWGSNGTGDAQFYGALGIATDSSGNVYVTDYYPNRIQKFTSNGTFITKWGSNGTADEQINFPHSIATDSFGNVYVVADPFNSTVKKFTTNGTFIKKWYGIVPRMGSQLNGIAVSPSGDVYVGNIVLGIIERFTGNGTFVSQFGHYDARGTVPFYGISTDSEGNIYITTHHHVDKFSYFNESSQMAHERIPPPQKQIANGVSPENIKCNDGFLWMRELSTKSIACVKPIAAQKLVERSWGTMLSSTITEQNNPIVLSDMIKVSYINFPIHYSITGGIVTQAKRDLGGGESLAISVQATTNGKLMIKIPRAIFRATTQSQELYFDILMDGQETDFQEIKTVGVDRTLVIPFKQGSHDVEFVAEISGP